MITMTFKTALCPFLFCSFGILLDTGQNEPWHKARALHSQIGAETICLAFQRVTSSSKSAEFLVPPLRTCTFVASVASFWLDVSGSNENGLSLLAAGGGCL